jgi:hypothetical protein
MDSFQNKIVHSLIEPNYIEEINSFIKGRKMWRETGLVFETFSKLCMGTGTILSFSSGVYASPTMSFIAGTVSTVSLVCLQFSSFCYYESKRSTEDLNLLLSTLKMDTIPDTIRSDPTVLRQKERERHVTEEVNEVNELDNEIGTELENGIRTEMRTEIVTVTDLNDLQHNLT